MVAPANVIRTNPYPVSNVGPNYGTPMQRPNYGHDQRNLAYPNTPQQTYAPNYDYGSRGYNYPNPGSSPSYPGSSYDSRNFDHSRLPSNPVQNVHAPSFGYEQNHSGPPRFGPQSAIPNHALGPNESHMESNQAFDHRNYGFSSASRHETNTQPHPGDVY